MKDFPLLPLFVRKAPGAAPEATINLTIKRGVRAALEYSASGEIAKARAATNPDVAPHLEFVDMAGHGYAVVSAGSDAIDTEFICIVRPIARRRPPTAVRCVTVYRIGRGCWQPGTPPKLEQRVLEGDASCQFDDLSSHRQQSVPLSACVADWARQDRKRCSRPRSIAGLIARSCSCPAIHCGTRLPRETWGQTGRNRSRTLWWDDW